MAEPIHIQQRQDKDVANIPIFYGDHKDSVTLHYFINRIDSGVQTLNWTQATAFTYFRNATRSTAAAWLESFLKDNPEVPALWNDIKVHFRKAFGDSTDPVIFAQQVFHIRPQQFDNELYKYYNAITQAVNLHEEEFLPPQFPEMPEEQEFTEEQIAFLTNFHKNTYVSAVQNVHTKLRKEFFLNGLPKAQLELVVDKPHLTTVHQMIAAIHQHESVEKKKNGNNATTSIPTSVHAVHSKPEPEVDEIAAAAFRNQNPRGSFRGNNTNYRGNNYRGNFVPRGNGYNNSFGQRQNNGQNYQNSQNSATKNLSGKTCIFCRRWGHIQDVCRDRISKGEPCIDSTGKTYFPKPNISANHEVVANSVFFLEN